MNLFAPVTAYPVLTCAVLLTGAVHFIFRT
jgi:hypothetical protein